MWGATVKCGCRYSPPTEGRKDLRLSRRFCGAGTGGDYRSGQCRLNLDWIIIKAWISPFCLPKTEKFLGNTLPHPQRKCLFTNTTPRKRGPPPCALFSLLFADLFPSPFLRRHLQVMPFISHEDPKFCMDVEKISVFRALRFRIIVVIFA